MRRPAFLTVVLFGILAIPASAHEGNPNFESTVTAVRNVPGLKAEIIGGDDHLLLINEAPKTVTVLGYDDEPYVRMEPDGRVLVNQKSEATYINEDRFGQVKVPAGVGADVKPVWKQVSTTGRFEFHDHRIHWMSKSDPPQVTDRAKRTKVFDWTVPVREAGVTGPSGVRGELVWRGEGGGPPTGAFLALGLLALASVALVVVVRRRRRGGPEKEAW
jgi:hypothetical protein